MPMGWVAPEPHQSHGGLLTCAAREITNENLSLHCVTMDSNSRREQWRNVLGKEQECLDQAHHQRQGRTIIAAH